MKAINLLLSMALLAACGDTEPKETNEPAAAENKAPASPAIQCYQYTSPADTVTLQFVQSGESVNGELIYLLKEKDSNRGNIQGTLKGDLLIADYTFQSEGVKSTRQVAFKKEGDLLVEGYGDVVEENGVTKFKNVNSLKFESSIKLQVTPCK